MAATGRKLPLTKIRLNCGLVVHSGPSRAEGIIGAILTQDQFSRRNIAKLALEGAVVVASILIAFALDAWWAERQLEQEIAEDLSIV